MDEGEERGDALVPPWLVNVAFKNVYSTLRNGRGQVGLYVTNISTKLLCQGGYKSGLCTQKARLEYSTRSDKIFAEIVKMRCSPGTEIQWPCARLEMRHTAPKQESRRGRTPERVFRYNSPAHASFAHARTVEPAAREPEPKFNREYATRRGTFEAGELGSALLVEGEVQTELDYRS